MIQIILLALLPVFFILLLGYTAGKFHVISHGHVGALNAFLMNYALPAALFVATASSSRSDLFSHWPFLVVIAGAMMAVYAIWYLAWKHGMNRPQDNVALQALTISLPNAAAIGIPVTTALFQSGHLIPVALVITAGTLLPSPLSLAMLELSAARAQNPGRNGNAFVQAIALAFRKPVVLAPILGTALSLSNHPISPLVTALLLPISASAGGMALFITGLILSAQQFRLSWEGILATLAANVLRPLIALGLALMLPMPSAMMKQAVLFAAFPCGFYGILFGASYGVKTDDVSFIVIASTVCAAATLALTMTWLYH